MNQLAFLCASMDNIREGINIIDSQGRIVYTNQAYREFLGMDAQEIHGRLLRDIRAGAKLPEVASSGRPLMHVVRKEEADIYFVNMYPIFKDGEVVGGISVVTFMADAYGFRKELEKHEKRSKEILEYANQSSGARYTFDQIVARSPNFVAIKRLAQRLAATEATIFLESESGTGKELFAQAIHNASPRSSELFVAINCANFQETMLESELFGYVEGAFTGAKAGGKIGLFEAAQGGTLFLDEISEMDISLQSKLLRVLQEKRFRPVGGIEEIDVDVRIICASNANLQEYIEAGKFRQDLYYRLSALPVRIPPLRERPEDIAPLCESILSDISQSIKRPITIDSEAVEVLKGHRWPGNVRELRNVLEFCAYISETGKITIANLPDYLIKTTSSLKGATLAERVRAFEKNEIESLLKSLGNSLEAKKRAAEELGISLATLYVKLKE